MTIFNIAIVSDTVCPWCYVGKKKLDRAISAYTAAHPGTKDTFVVTWHPFYLNPNAPKKGIDKREFLEAKFGAQRAPMIFDRLASVGNEVGINFKHGGKTGNTRDSHRLIQLGKTKSLETHTKVVDELFASYFENEEDITSHDVLRKVGVRAGIPDNEVKAWLESDQGGAKVDREVEVARMNHITSVPNFTLQGKYEIGGAQDSQAFVDVFEMLKAAEGS